MLRERSLTNTAETTAGVLVEPAPAGIVTTKSGEEEATVTDGIEGGNVRLKIGPPPPPPPPPPLELDPLEDPVHVPDGVTVTVSVASPVGFVMKSRDWLDSHVNVARDEGETVYFFLSVDTISILEPPEIEKEKFESLIVTESNVPPVALYSVPSEGNTKETVSEILTSFAANANRGRKRADRRILVILLQFIRVFKRSHQRIIK